MAAGFIQGIIIKLKGDTSALSESLSSVNKSCNALQKTLKQVDNALKLDPKNTELLAEKQKILATNIQTTEGKLKALKEVQEKAKDAMANGDIGQEEYSKLTAEVAKTETALKNLKAAAIDCEQAGMRNLADGLSTAGDKMEAAGQKMLGVTTAIVGAGVAATKMASDFEDGMAKVSTLVDTSQVDMQQLSDQALQVSNAYGTSATDVAEAMYQAISASVDYADAAGFVDSANKLSTAGFTDLTSATDIMTTVLNSYKMSADQTTHVSDVLLATQNKGKTTVDELSKSMGKVIPTAGLYNVSLENVASAYSVMTANGINTETSTTILNTMFSELGKSGSNAANILDKKVGKSFSELMESGYTLSEVLSIVKDGAEESGQSLGDIFGQTAIKGANTLATNTELFADNLMYMNGCVGLTEESFEKMQTPSYKLKQSINQLKNAFMEFGQKLTPIITKAADAIKNITKKINDMDDGTKETILKILGIVAAIGPLLIVGGKLTKGISTTITAVLNLQKAMALAKVGTTAATGAAGALSGAFTALCSPIGLVVAALAAVCVGVALFSKNSKDATKESKELLDATKKQADAMEEQRQAYLDSNEARKETIGQGLAETSYYQSLYNELTKIVDTNGKVQEGYEARAQFITDTLSGAMGTEITITDGVIDNYTELTSTFDELMAKKKAYIILDSQEEAYSEALKNRTNFMQDMYQKQQEIKDLQADLDDMRNQKASDSFARFSHDELVQWEINYKNKTETLNNLQQEYDTASAQFKDYTDDISMYEANYALVSEGHYDELYTNVQEYTSSKNDCLQESLATAQQTYQEESNLLDWMVTKSKETNSSITADDLAAQQEKVRNAQENVTAQVNAINEGSGSISQAWLNSQAQQISDLKGQQYQFKDLGDGTVQMLVDGIEIGKPTAKGAMKGLVDDLKDPNNFLGTPMLGLNLIQGLANGITQNSALAQGSASAASQDVINSMKTGLGVHSPSVYTQQMGVFLDQGLAQGITAGAPTVKAALTTMTTGALSNLRATITTQFTTLNPQMITIGTTIIRSLINGITAATSSLQTALLSIKTFITSAFNGMSLSGQGANIISSLRSGMESQYGSIIGSLNGLLGQVRSVASSIAWEASRAASSGGSYINGSHAQGLAYVPFDGYIAELHKGERVLTASEAKDYDNVVPKNGGTFVVNQTITTTSTAREQQREAERQFVKLGLGV